MADAAKINLYRGRGAPTNRSGRFETEVRFAVDDGWDTLADAPPALPTEVLPDASRRVITTNDSPDVPFNKSVNPYRGCEHGCAYCFARASHAYFGLSPGLDFESRLFAKHDAPAQLAGELRRYRGPCEPLAIGVNTDAYQPVEKRLRITRGILETADRFNQPVVLITKSDLILRDLDVLGDLAARRLVNVMISITTLDGKLARALEPRAPAPHKRLRAVQALAGAGVPVGIMAAPLIPALNDHEIEAILSAAAENGARAAAYILLRLPGEVAPLFREWLAVHRPDRAARVMKMVREGRGGRDNDARFGHRMRGTGPYAALITQRFHRARHRFGLADDLAPLDTASFSRDGQYRLL